MEVPLKWEIQLDTYKPPEEFEAEILKLKPAKRPTQKIWGYAV